MDQKPDLLEGALDPSISRILLGGAGHAYATWELSDKGKRARYYNLTREGGSSFRTSDRNGMRLRARWG